MRLRPVAAGPAPASDATYPARDKESDGCCGDARHSARASDHNSDSSGHANALDVDRDFVPGDPAASDRAMQALIAGLQSDPRTKYLIFEAQIWFPTAKGSRPKGWSPYHGPNAHRHHLHLSQIAGSALDKRPWPIKPPAVAARPAPATPRRKPMFLIRAKDRPAVYVTDCITKRWLQTEEQRDHLLPVLSDAGVNVTIREWDPADVDAIPTIGVSPPAGS